MMKGDLKVRVEPRPDRAVQVTLDGALDAHTFDRFRKTITDLSTSGTLWIVLDLTKMIYIASVGLNFLVNARVMQRKAGGEMILVGPQPQVMTILKMLGLLEVLVLAPSCAEAWEKIRDGIQPLP
ncbi:MAG TPA: STAS domain-containing protein [Planctomycetota bacterium]|nr:STAS domain-containing protein [Planctomycetota bacterium]